MAICAAVATNADTSLQLNASRESAQSRAVTCHVTVVIGVESITTTGGDLVTHWRECSDAEVTERR